VPADAARGDLSLIRSLLEQDRVWGAYALADLEPPFSTKTSWLVGDRALVMVYAGLAPSLLFAHGEPREVAELLAEIPAGVTSTAPGNTPGGIGRPPAPGA
jgi:hypothetical protein